MHLSKPLLLSSLSAVLLLCACGAKQNPGGISSTQDSSTANSQVAIINGQPQKYFGATVTSWSDLEHEEIGFTLPLSVIQNVPTTLPAGADPMHPDPLHSVRIDLPAEVKAATFLDHIDVDYNPVGHPPAPAYVVPHFDIHYYGISAADQKAIDCTDSSTIATNRLPDHFVVSKPGLPPEGECVPAMGLHAVDDRSPELQPKNPAPFTKTMILGYYQGRMTFVEPMITREYLLQKQDFTMDIPHPDVVARDTLLPTKFTATYDKAKDEYRFVVSEFEEVE